MKPLISFGPMCWNSNLEVTMRANYLCNDYGLDTISTGVTIAFAMECHEKNILSDPELSLEWGDPDSILGLIEKIGNRDGIGDLLANGVKASCRNYRSGCGCLCHAGKRA